MMPSMFDSPLVVFPLAALTLSAALHALALYLFPRWGLLDFPERYGHARARIPYPAGIVSVALFLAFLPLLLPLNLQTVGLMAAIAILGLTCLRDDRAPLSPLTRIAIQLGIAILLVACGVRIAAITNPLAGIYGTTTLQLQAGAFYWFSIVFTVLWILATINALNWFDGIPGQVSTISTIGFLTIGLLSLSARVNQPALALVAFTLAGISLGCLFFDLPPPHLLIGDTGAMFYGLMIGVLTIYSGGKVATAFLVLGVPLIDLLFVIARRIKRRQSIFRGNSQDQHLHHRLLRKGWSARQVTLFTAFVGTAFGITALFLDTHGKFIATGVLFLLMLAMSSYSNPRGSKS